MATKVTNLIGSVNVANVTEVCKTIAGSVGAKIKYGPTNELTNIVAVALDVFKVMDKKDFLARVCMAIPPDIYMFFKPGDAHPKPYHQVVLTVHECQHVLDWQENPLKYTAEYYTSKAKRAYYEQRAVAAMMECQWRLTGKMDPVDVYVENLNWYKLTKADLEVTAKALTIHQRALRRGAQVSPFMSTLQAAVGR